MTNPVMEEIYALTEKALKAKQEHVQVHVFPFRMTEANLDRFRSSRWHAFWQNLKAGYDAFEATRTPPQIEVCDNRYVVQQVSLDDMAEHERPSLAEDGTRLPPPRHGPRNVEPPCRAGAAG
jgi:murein L,D-transpeptidase YafK